MLRSQIVADVYEAGFHNAMTQVREMAYANNQWDDDAIRQLAHCIDVCKPSHDTTARAPGLLNLTALHLASNELTDEGVRAIVGAISSKSQLPHLAVLDLSHNSVGDAAVEAIAAIAPLLPGLRELDLTDTCITDQAIYHLIDAGKMR